MRKITFLLPVFVFLVAACGDGGAPTAPTPTLPPDAGAVFPTVLEHDTRIIATADGSEITEVPVEYRPRTATFGYVSPRGGLTASYREGTVFVQEDGGEAMAIAELPADAEFATIIWSPDGSKLLVGAANAGVYVVKADGSGMVEVAVDLEGAIPRSWSADSKRVALSLFSPTESFALATNLYVAEVDGTGHTLVGQFSAPQGDAGWQRPTWSPDGSRIAILFAPSFGGIRLLDTSGGPAVDILADASTLKMTWSPDSRFLAFDVNSGRPEEAMIMVVEVSSPEDARILTQGHWPRWSPDGSRIAFKRGDFTSSQVYSIRPDGSDLVSLGDMGPEARSELTWSADGESVEFIRSAPAAQHLYAVELATGAVVRSPGTISKIPFTGPRRYVWLSPNGDEIAFVMYDFEKQGGGEAGWFTMDILSGELTQVTDDARAGDVFWSSEGIRIAYSTGLGGVYVTESDGSAPRQISGVANFFGPMAWSPDGRSLAFFGNTNIHVVDVETTDETIIAAGLTGDSNSLAALEWSPDGTELLYVANHYDEATGTNTNETFIARLDGRPPRQLVATGAGADTARWSPDGETIAFSRLEAAEAGLWLVEADGGNERRIARFDGMGFAFGPLHWSPDGESIAVLVSGRDIYVIDVETGVSVLVATNVGNCLMSLVGWSPNSDVIYAIPACALGGL